ncbi:hypothetical protein FISHEDRAFT_78616 [Fistulina hepatica ATCC 64428]|uniref:Protein kinase domain-containing protein n=1 Tax=Fistulina hepatica ATCC 64428 TaxID=1128425 RepID=A0A0D7A1M3_9AGAR|nr:hypothetical protein FISHEDRAFT_78616 [Fistulina hepatica ATCC 64428]
MIGWSDGSLFVPFYLAHIGEVPDMGRQLLEVRTFVFWKAMISFSFTPGSRIHASKRHRAQGSTPTFSFTLMVRKLILCKDISTHNILIDHTRPEYFLDFMDLNIFTPAYAYINFQLSSKMPGGPGTGQRSSYYAGSPAFVAPEVKAVLTTRIFSGNVFVTFEYMPLARRLAAGCSKCPRVSGIFWSEELAPEDTPLDMLDYMTARDSARRPTAAKALEVVKAVIAQEPDDVMWLPTPQHRPDWLAHIECVLHSIEMGLGTTKTKEMESEENVKIVWVSGDAWEEEDKSTFKPPLPATLKEWQGYGFNEATRSMFWYPWEAFRDAFLASGYVLYTRLRYQCGPKSNIIVPLEYATKEIPLNKHGVYEFWESNHGLYNPKTQLWFARTKDGIDVVLKVLSDGSDPDGLRELDILRKVSTEPLKSHPDNHCVPVLEFIEHGRWTFAGTRKRLWTSFAK